MHYADSSFLVALYLGCDAHSARANAWMARTSEPIAFTPLQRLELRNAIRLHQWRGHIESNVARGAIRQTDQDLQDGFLVHVAAGFADVCRKADELSEQNSGCRTLDLIHAATALVIRANDFLSFDKRQRMLAKGAGLNVMPRMRGRS